MAKDSKTDKDSKPEGKEAKAPKATKKPGDETAAVKTQAKGEAKKKAETKEKSGGKKQPGTPMRPLIFQNQTKFAKTGEVPSEWRLIDATGLPLGRLSSHIAMLLMGKHKPIYTRSVDTGDHVVVINAEKVALTGKKWEDKEYHQHTNYPGGLKTFTAKYIRETHPERLIEKAVYRMLPKWKAHMVRHWFGKLKVYAGETHPHTAQKPQPVKLPNLGISERT